MNKSMSLSFQSIEFINALKKKEDWALEKLIVSYTDQLMKAAYGIGFRNEQAEELVQSVWFTFIEKAESFEGRSHVRTFLFGILYNKAREMRRKFDKDNKHEQIDQIMEERFLSDGHWQYPPLSPDQFLQAAEQAEWIQACLSELSTDQKTAFLMKEVEGEKTQDICKILQLTDTNLGVLLYRAKNRLRECIEKKAKHL